jgi:hypothetical protein
VADLGLRGPALGGGLCCGAAWRRRRAFVLALAGAATAAASANPAPEVLERYRLRGIAIVVSPACRAWLWLSCGPGNGTCRRDAVRRYWHHGAVRDSG